MSKRLYRDIRQGWLSGVCAGLGHYFSIEIWIIRVLVIFAAFFSGGFLVILAYIATVLFIDKAPNDFYQETKNRHWNYSIKDKPWQVVNSASDLIEYLNAELSQMDRKISDIEKYVDSVTKKMNKI